MCVFILLCICEKKMQVLYVCTACMCGCVNVSVCVFYLHCQVIGASSDAALAGPTWLPDVFRSSSRRPMHLRPGNHGEVIMWDHTRCCGDRVFLHRLLRSEGIKRGVTRKCRKCGVLLPLRKWWVCLLLRRGGGGGGWVGKRRRVGGVFSI